MEQYKQYFDANKSLWNKRTTVHKDSSFYDVEGFKAGKNVLTPIELNELGDVKGKKLLHLQCHFGMDTLNWARLGADVTGVDLSDVAIEEARKLNDELGLNGKFVCANIYDLAPSQPPPPAGGEELTTSNRSKKLHHSNSSEAPSTGGGLGEASFDIIYTSYGVVGWLPDLDKWAEIISYYLKPGGIFYIAEFHPVIWMFDDEFKEIRYSYENREVIETENQGTYTDKNADIKEKEYGWNHSLSEVINAVISHGLEIQFLNEHMYSPYPCFSNMVQNKDGNWWIKGLEDKIPMVYSIKAKKR